MLTVTPMAVKVTASSFPFLTGVGKSKNYAQFKNSIPAHVISTHLTSRTKARGTKAGKSLHFTPLALELQIHFYNGGEDDHPGSTCSKRCRAAEKQCLGRRAKIRGERGRSVGPQGPGRTARIQQI